MRFIILVLLSVFIISCGRSPMEVYSDGTAKYDKGEFQEALVDFKLFRDQFPEDSLAPKVLYKMVRVNLDRLRDYDAGKSIYNDLIMNYPVTIEGKQAKIELKNFSSWLFTKAEILQGERKIREAIITLGYILKEFPDSDIAPKVNYSLGDIHMNDLRDFPEALKSYRLVLSEFPESENAPRAKFMLGFIYANLLNDLDNAKIEYEEFLKNYPGHELEPSVQFELKFLGQDINSINELNNINM